MAYLEELLPEFRKGAKIRLKGWNSGCFIFMKDNTVYNEDKEPLDGFEVDSYDVFSDDGWELYQEPIDWDYIIKNRCLCRFWDNEESKIFTGILALIAKEDYMPFLLYGGNYFRNCRPVRRDEVTFYEDRENE